MLRKKCQLATFREETQRVIGEIARIMKDIARCESE
jgi:hypothetical protein